MDKTQTIGIGIAVFFLCMLAAHVIAYEVFYLPFILCLIFSLIISALTVFFLRLHLRISRLEQQVEHLTKQLYRVEERR